MAAMIGQLAVNLSLETAAFQKGASLAEKRTSAMSKRLNVIGSKIGDIGKNISLGLTAPLAAFAATGIKQAQEQAAALGQVNAALASMGPVAGRTSEQLAKTADALEMKSLFDADVILTKVTANLLTFGNVAGEQFDRAQQAAIDMATRMGSDPQNAAIMLGKALNDPINGIAALTRVGVQFSAQQKEQIKQYAESGQAAKAQAVILAEVEKQFAGSAQAAANADPMRKLTVEFNKAAEAIGTAILPLLPVLTDALVKVLNAFTSLSPSVQKFILIGGGIAAALGPALLVIGPMVSGFTALLPIMAKLGPIFSIVRVAMLALFANPVLLAAAALIAGIYLAWQNWDKIEPILRRLYTGVKTWIMDKLGAVWKSVTDKIETVRKAFYNLYDAVVGNSYVPDMVDGIAQHMGRLGGVMVEPTLVATDKTAEAFKDLEVNATESTETMAQAFERNTKNILGSMTNLASSIKSGGFLGILEGLSGVFMSLGSAGAFGKGVAGRINNPNPTGLARGGNMTSNRTYLTGERGPELITMGGRPGYVTPNNKMNGGGRGQSISIVPSPYFNVVVDGRADGRVAGAAPGIATAAAKGVQTNMQQSNFRSLP